MNDIEFARDTLVAAALSLPRFHAAQEATIGPLRKLVETLENDTEQLARLRSELDKMAAEIFEDNTVEHAVFI